MTSLASLSPRTSPSSPKSGTDSRISLIGAVAFANSAKQVGVKPLIGASFEMEQGGELVLIARSKVGYQNLSRLTT